MRAASLGSSSSSSRTPRSARPMRPPALMRGPSRKPRCQGSGGPDKPRCVHQRGQPDLLAPAQRDQALGDEGAVEAFQRHHVGDGAERDQMQQRQQVGLAAQAGPEVAPAQFARQRHQRDEHQTDGGEMAETGEIVGAVRIDDRHRRRQFLVGLMMVEDDNVERRACGLRRAVTWLVVPQSTVTRSLTPRSAKRADGVDIRPVAFENAVRNVDDRIEPAVPQIARQQGRGGGAVDVVIAENRYIFRRG